MKQSSSVWQTRRQDLLTQMQHAGASWLGFTEPTLCGRAGVRLHEKHPSSSELQAESTSDLIFHKAEYAAQQLALGIAPAAAHIHLPRLVQYDLAHVVEGLPETRARAAEDQQHSFLQRQPAFEVLVEHLTAFHQEGVVPVLVWHAFHPVHGDKSIYEMPGVDPFAATKTDEEPALLVSLAKHLHLSAAEWPSSLTETQRQVLTTMQAKLQRIADFANSLAEEGIVAIFRPYHEANGHWFWWAIDRFSDNPNEAAELFWKLWKNTRTYLETTCGVQNLVYAWSPNIAGSWFQEEADLVSLYTRGIHPEAIDILGIDCYANNLSAKKEALLSHRREVLLKGLEVIAALRRAFPDKPVGFTELGLRYHELLKDDVATAKMGEPSRGGGTLNEPFFKRFSQFATYPPHFTIFWRNEPHSLEFPLAGLSPEMEQEVRGMYTYFDTLVRAL
ncbi:glycosyl hydrolase [Lewinella sp. LCG006]|uniref:glycosyl hydrolase n=1 Tax=Lewinella sp. LCG006 TaxID=3231911 RepID=UPI00345FE0F6